MKEGVQGISDDAIEDSLEQFMKLFRHIADKVSYTIQVADSNYFEVVHTLVASILTGFVRRILSSVFIQEASQWEVGF